MKTTVITGMLGAGKTTFIQNYLKNTEEKTLILVNDFGKTGIDGELISQINPETIELPSGCVCCTLRYDLITTLKRALHEISPEHLLIEPSGIASVSGIADALNQAGLTEFTVITIIDSVEFLDLYQSGMYGEFFKDQIKNADLLLINKIDLSETPKIMKTREVIKGLNPSSIIIPTVRAKLSMDLPSASRAKRSFSNNSHLHLKTLAINIPPDTGKDRIEKLFREFITGKFGNIVRAKALIKEQSGSYLIDIASGKCFTRPLLTDTKRNRMVVIFEDTDVEKLKSEVLKWLR